MKQAVIGLSIVLAFGALAGAYYIRRGGPEVQVNTSPITRGDLVDTVGASGTLQAVTTVQVGSQVSGNIQYLGADFNSIVKKGQVVARLDPSLFDAQLQQAKANLAQARANLAKAQSDLDRTKVQLTDAQQKYARAKELAARSLLPQADLDSAKTAVDTAQAGLSSQQATVAQTQAAVSQSQASVNQNQVNLDHTVIEAPIDGIVTQRNVDVGQTVAASMQAPTLFVIAADLTKMQVNANIDEADVGRIRPGQHVTFKVDAYPTETFEGTVSQIRLQPVVVQNVTTYGTVIDVPNAQLKLKPGMTAHVKVEIAKRTDALRVPNAALRFRPSSDLFAAINQPVPPEATYAGGRGGRGGGGNRTGPATSASADASSGTAPARTTPPASATRSFPLASAPDRGSRGGPGGPDGAPSAHTEGGGRSADRRGGGRGVNPDLMMERFKGMSSDKQTPFIARTKDSGQDTRAFEQAGKATARRSSVAQSIDALFAPLPTVESRGRVWICVQCETPGSRTLKPVSLRLGVSDGTNTELLGDELQQDMDVITGVTGLGPLRAQPGAGSGNPLMPRGPQGGRGR